MIKKIDANKYGVVRYAISSIEDIADLPREVSVGSEAILVNEDGEKKFRLGSDGWVEVVEVKEYDEDKLRDILEDAKVGYGGIEYETLEERLEKDFDSVYSVLDNRTYVGYEGCRITAKDSLNGLQKETVVKGRTLQNIVKSYESSGFKMICAEMVSEGVFKLPEGTDVNETSVRAYAENHLYKTNTTYTVFVDILENTTGKKLGISNINSMIKDDYEREFQNLTGVSYARFTTTADGLTTKGVDPLHGIYFGIWSANDTSGEFSKYIKFKYWIFEGDHTQTPLEELPFIEGIESVGDKSKNLFDGEWEVGGLDWDNGKNKDAERDRIRTGFISVEENKKYKANQSFTHIFFFNKDKSLLSYKTTITSIETPNECKYIRLLKMNTAKILYDFQVEEGEIITPYQPYYDGYKISGKSCGKNLWKPVLHTKANAECEIQEDKVIVMGKEDTNWNNVRLKVKVKRNTDYFLSFNCDNPNGYISCRTEELKLIKDFNKSPARFNSGENEDVFFLMHCSLNTGGIHVVEYSNIQLEEATAQTSYEPYKESTYSYILDEPLRSLPDGVCDEIDLEKGIVTRRVGRVVLDGTNWSFDNISSISNILTNCMCFGISSTNWDKPMISNPSCNTAIVSNVPYIVNNEDVFHWRGSYGTLDGVNYGTFMLFIEKTKLTTLDSVGVNEWLSKNNIEVVYQLLTPTTEYLIKDDKFVTLPNGVKDEVGRIVTRNVGKIVLDGSRKWTGSAIKNENHIKYFTYINDENGERLKVDDAPIISPTFPVIGCGQNSGDLDKYKQDIEGLYADTTISISVAKNRLETEDAEGLKKWLSQNPITVYYELTKPYIECSYEKYPTLPNGVKDEISHNSVLRKVGKIVLDGSEEWLHGGIGSGGNDSTLYAIHDFPSKTITNNNSIECICDTLPVYTANNCWRYTGQETICSLNVLKTFHIRIHKSKLSEDTPTGFKKWLSQNPITVWYELETPYTEPINLNEVILDTIRLKSYEPITHIASDNYLPPTIKTQVPSDFNAVVLGLKSNNEALTSQVMSLRQTNDELEATNREQDDVIDVTLLALDEVYGMIDEGEIEAMSIGSPMVNVYVKMIKRGIKTLDEVPTKYRAEVEKLI